ncbi:MAG: hypothetical protein IKZ22_04880 [Kiritimatiellae bacterium]|nr:hypothetical protein [Kiritimatiellia bacterium]
MKSKTTVVAVLMMLAAGLRAAGPVVHAWRVHADDPDNILTNDVHVSVPLAEIPACDRIQVLNESADMTVRLPEGTDYTSTLAAYFQADKGRALTLDFKDAVWTQRDTDASDPYTHDGRFMLGLGGSSVFTYAWSGHALNGAFRLENALLTITNNVNGVRSVDFLRGSFNFLDPNGASNAGAYLYIAGGASGTAPFDMNFHSGSSLRAPIFFIYAIAPTNNINFLGGEHYIAKLQPRVRNSGGNDDYARTRVNILGKGTKLTIADFNPADGNRHGYQIYVGNEGALHTTGAITQLSGSEYAFVFDNGYLNTDGTKLTWNNALVFATNSCFNIGTLSLNHGRMELKDCTSSVNYASLGSGSGASVMEINGGTADFGTLHIGHSQGADIVLKISSAKVRDSVQTTLGTGEGSKGRLVLGEGGRLDESANLVIGGLGHGELKVEGGVLTTPRLHFVWNDAARWTTNILHQTGGTIEVGSAFSVIAAQECKNTHAEVILEGGVLAAPYVIGGAGCSGLDPSKTSDGILIGNGGTVRATADSAGFIKNFTAAKCGIKGLTVESDYAVTIPQSFVDLDENGGRLVLTGSGVKTLSGTATSVSNIVVAGGTLVFAAGARAQSNLIVKNGAKVVFTDDPAVIGLESFVCGDEESFGVISLKAGVRLDFGTMPITFNSVRLELDGDFSAAGLHSFLTTRYAVSEETKAAWADALGKAGFADDRSYVFSSASAEGRTEFGMTVSAAAHVFKVEEGAVRETSDVDFGNMETLVAEVAAGATLSLDGKLAKGGLLKTGGGSLFVDGASNEFLRGVKSEAGFFSVASYGALGLSGLGVGDLELGGGTFEFCGDGQTVELPCTLAVASADVHAPVGLKIESPLTVRKVDISGGVILKRGMAPLTFAPPPGGTMVLSSHDSGNGAADPKSPYSIGDISGRADVQPATGYMGFNVVEGEVRFVGGSDTLILSEYGMMIGVSAKGGREQPALTIDGTRVKFGGGTVQLGGFTQADSFNTSPRLSIVNGAQVEVYNFICGRNTAIECHPVITVDGSTLKVASFRAGYNWNNYPTYSINNSRIAADNVLCYGPSRFYLTNSVFEVKASGTAEMHGNGGRWLFGPGSKISLSNLKTTSASPCSGFTLAFDGGEWITGASDRLFRLYKSEVFRFETLGAGLTLPVDEGASLPVARAITGPGPLVKTGKGAIVFETQGTYDETLGEKTALDDPVSLAFDGELDVREGSVVIAEGACRDGGRYMAAEGALVDFGGNQLGGAEFTGSGTFRAFTATDVKILIDAENPAAPRLENAGFVGRTVIDFGCTEDSPLDWRNTPVLPVAKFTGALPDISGWRVKGVGNRSVGGKFTVSGDGVVSVKLVWRGLTLFVR